MQSQDQTRMNNPNTQTTQQGYATNPQGTNPQSGYGQAGQQQPSATQQVKNVATPGVDRLGNPKGEGMHHQTGMQQQQQQGMQPSTTQQVKNAVTPGVDRYGNPKGEGMHHQTGVQQPGLQQPVGQQRPATSTTHAPTSAAAGVTQLNNQHGHHEKSTGQKIKEKITRSSSSSSLSSDEGRTGHKKGLKEKLVEKKDDLKEKMGLSTDRDTTTTTTGHHGTTATNTHAPHGSTTHGANQGVYGASQQQQTPYGASRGNSGY